MAGMKLKGKGIVLSCESKTSTKGNNYFLTTIGGIGFGNDFFTKGFVKPSDKEVELEFEYVNGKLNLIEESLK